MISKRLKIWAVLSTAICFVLVCALGWVSNVAYFYKVEAKKQNLQEYTESWVTNNTLLENGYIPNAHTAAKIGGEIIDNICGERDTKIGFVDVAYDGTLRIWKVTKTYGVFDRQSACVILDQDTGMVIGAFFQEY